MLAFQISRWLVSKTDVCVANSFCYNHYHEGKESNYFLSTDRINAVVVLPIAKVNSYYILFMQDFRSFNKRLNICFSFVS